jgi:hypothetical protein
LSRIQSFPFQSGRAHEEGKKFLSTSLVTPPLWVTFLLKVFLTLNQFANNFKAVALHLIDNFKVSPASAINPNAAAIHTPGTTAYTTRITALTDQTHLRTNSFSAPMPPHVARFAINSV